MSEWRTHLRILLETVLLALTLGALPLWLATRTAAAAAGLPLPPA